MRVAILQIRSLRIWPSILRMSLSQNRYTLWRDMLRRWPALRFSELSLPDPTLS